MQHFPKCPERESGAFKADEEIYAIASKEVSRKQIDYDIGGIEE